MFPGGRKAGSEEAKAIQCAVCVSRHRISHFHDSEASHLTAIWTHIYPLLDIFALRRKDALAQIFATCPFPTDS